jgi:phospholipase/carboxylesterase
MFGETDDLPRRIKEISPLYFVTDKAPPLLLIHGDSDELIPVQALFHASSSLQALDVPVEWHISQGVGHGIDQEGLRHGGEFLARRFGLGRS